MEDTQLRFWDHDSRARSRTSLARKLELSGAQLDYIVPKNSSEDECAVEIAKKFLCKSDWRVGVIHAKDSVWQAFCEHATGDRVLVRVSTVNQERFVRVVNSEAICLQLRPSLEDEKVKDNLIAILKKMELRDVRESIRKGDIPPELVYYFGLGIGCAKNRAAALWIVAVGYLATVAGPWVSSSASAANRSKDAAHEFLRRQGWTNDTLSRLAQFSIARSDLLDRALTNEADRLLLKKKDGDFLDLEQVLREIGVKLGFEE